MSSIDSNGMLVDSRIIARRFPSVENGARAIVVHFQAVTPQQNISLQWLITELYGHLKLTGKDVYRHPEVSYKNPDEAGSATWQ